MRSAAEAGISLDQGLTPGNFDGFGQMIQQSAGQGGQQQPGS